MHPRTHFWTSALTAAVVYPRSLRRAALLTMAGVLIDADHLILYALKTGDWSITGALRYNRYRNQPLAPGDTRPRYGSLRSLIHHPLLTLPTIWMLAWHLPMLQPIAWGVSLHLILDHVHLPRYWRIHRQAQGRCAWCGADDRRLSVYPLPIAVQSGDQITREITCVALCPACFAGYKRTGYMQPTRAMASEQAS